VTDLKTFVPAKDPEISKKFYVDLGLAVNWSTEQIAELRSVRSDSCYRPSMLPSTPAIS